MATLEPLQDETAHVGARRHYVMWPFWYTSCKPIYRLHRIENSISIRAYKPYLAAADTDNNQTYPWHRRLTSRVVTLKVNVSPLLPSISLRSPPSRTVAPFAPHAPSCLLSSFEVPCGAGRFPDRPDLSSAATPACPSAAASPVAFLPGARFAARWLSGFSAASAMSQ